MDEDDNMDIDETDPEPPAVEPPKLEVNETKAAKAEVSPAPKKSTITISLNALSNEHRKKLFIRWKRPTDIKPTSKALELKPQKTSAPPAKVCSTTFCVDFYRTGSFRRQPNAPCPREA